jgi:phosphopantothenoylcysteine synthetase/decarboxylase
VSPRVLYVIVCAAPPAAGAARLVRLAQQDGWDVCVLTSPRARAFADVGGLERLTGHQVRSEYKNPGEPDVLPPPDAIIVAPATVNTVNKWALGICDTLTLGILVEAIGKRLPVAAVLSTNREHAAHPALAESIAKLRSWGVTVLEDPQLRPGGEPGGGDPERFGWRAALAAISRSPRGGSAPGG